MRSAYAERTGHVEKGGGRAKREKGSGWRGKEAFRSRRTKPHRGASPNEEAWGARVEDTKEPETACVRSRLASGCDAILSSNDDEPANAGGSDSKRLRSPTKSKSGVRLSEAKRWPSGTSGWLASGRLAALGPETSSRGSALRPVRPREMTATARSAHLRRPRTKATHSTPCRSMSSAAGGPASVMALDAPSGWATLPLVVSAGALGRATAPEAVMSAIANGEAVTLSNGGSSEKTSSVGSP